MLEEPDTLSGSLFPDNSSPLSNEEETQPEEESTSEVKNAQVPVIRLSPEDLELLKQEQSVLNDSSSLSLPFNGIP